MLNQANMREDLFTTIGMSFLTLKYALAANPIKVALAAILGVLGTFFAPIGGFLVAMSVMVVLDIFTGIQAAKKRGDKITAARMKQKIGDMIAYALLIIATETITFAFFQGVPIAQSITYTAALFICGVELKSIAENVYESTGIDVWDKIKGFFDKK